MANPPIMPILFPNGDPLPVQPPPPGVPNYPRVPGLDPCYDVPNTRTVYDAKGIPTCVPVVGSFDVMNIFGGGSNSWLWIAGGVVALILLTSGKRGRR